MRHMRERVHRQMTGEAGTDEYPPEHARRSHLAVLALVITLAAPVLIVVVRTRAVHATAQQKRRDTLTMLWVWRATFLLMSGVVVALHLPDAAQQRTSSTAPSPIPTMAPPPSPTSTPTSIPTLTPTPRLAHSTSIC